MGQRDPRVDAYIDKSAEFARPILSHLREVVHAACPQVEEAMKWSSPHFVYHGNLCAMAAFKQHATFGFSKGSLFVADGKRDEAMGQFGRISKLSDLPSKKTLTGYVKQAMALNEQGVKTPRTKSAVPKPPLPVPDDLAAALKKDAKARGVAFRGVGNEPGWLVEVDRGDSPAMRATLDYGERQVVVPQAQGISSTPGFGGRTADGVDVVLRIERASCSDGMSDDTYPAAIKLTVGDKTYSGCGRYLNE